MQSVINQPPLWSKLQLGMQIFEPWSVMGDFHAMLSTEDKQGGHPVASYDMQDFTAFVSRTSLVDLQSWGVDSLGLIAWFSTSWIVH